LFEHDLFGKPASAFPDHALDKGMVEAGAVSALDGRWRGEVVLKRDVFSTIERGYFRTDASTACRGGVRRSHTFYSGASAAR
jgi:hypothetical protein